MRVVKITALTLGSEIKVSTRSKVNFKIIFIMPFWGSLEWNLPIDMSAWGDFFVVMLLKATTKCPTLVLTVYFDGVSSFARTWSPKTADRSGQFIPV